MFLVQEDVARRKIGDWQDDRLKDEERQRRKSWGGSVV
jgi:hypothetical protein